MIKKKRLLKKLFLACLLISLISGLSGCATEVRPWSMNDVEMIRDMYFDEELIQLRKEVKEIR